MDTTDKKKNNFIKAIGIGPRNAQSSLLIYTRSFARLNSYSELQKRANERGISVEFILKICKHPERGERLHKTSIRSDSISFWTNRWNRFFYLCCGGSSLSAVPSCFRHMLVQYRALWDCIKYGTRFKYIAIEKSLRGSGWFWKRSILHGKNGSNIAARLQRGSESETSCKSIETKLSQFQKTV